MKKVLAVSHCLLNTAAKVRRFKEKDQNAEEALRKQVLKEAVDGGLQILQLPCPEFVMYGASRWGHTYDQFNNVFYREKCRELLAPVILELKEYQAHPEEFCLLGILGIDGSPSCGVKYTCRGRWGGDFGGRDMEPVLGDVHRAEGMGVFMEVLMEMLKENGLEIPAEGLFAGEPERALGLVENRKE